MANSSIWAPIGEQGPPGPTGDKGPPGDPGPQGAAGPDAAAFAAFKALIESQNGAADVGCLLNGAPSNVQVAINQIALAGNYVNVKSFPFNAKGDGVTDDTAAINAALDFCAINRRNLWMPAGNYPVREFSEGAGYAILNKGVGMFGEGALRTMITPLSSMGSTVDFIKFQPTENTVLDFVELSGLFIWPGVSGTKLGKRAVFVDMSAVTNASSFHIDGCYFAPGNDLSLEWVTTNNVQGGPANSLFERSHFWEGVKLTNHGDSNTFRNCVLRSSDGSGRVGINTTAINAGGGQAAQLTIEQCNIDCDGGAIYAANGLKYTIVENNIEQSHGSGSGSGACVDLDGTSGGIAWAVFSGNSVGAFGTSTLGSILRINNAAQTKVSHNRFSVASAANCPVGIGITPNATNTVIEQNEIGTAFTVAINDLGSGTIGVGKDITPANGFSNFGSGYQPLFTVKGLNGDKYVAGEMNCPGSASGLVFGTLPVGYRPAFVIRIPAIAVAGGNYVGAVVEISTSGSMTFLCATASPIRFSFAGSFGGLGFISGNL